jgi:hypothetical protein
MDARLPARNTALYVVHLQERKMVFFLLIRFTVRDCCGAARADGIGYKYPEGVL